MKYLLILMSIMLAFVVAVLAPILLIPLAIVGVILILAWRASNEDDDDWPDDTHGWGV